MEPFGKLTGFGVKETAWQYLIRLHAKGRTPCNCGDAYRDVDGGCPGGCSSNQITAKKEIAAAIVAAMREA